MTGLPIIYGIDPYSSETVPSIQLGSTGYTDDGRKFRYCRNNVTNAMVAGELQQVRSEDTEEQSVLVSATAEIGATKITLASSTVTAGQYEGGYLVATSEGGTGNGLYYRIKSHPAASAETLVITLEQPLEVAFSTSTQVDLVPNAYNLVIQNPASSTGVAVGVAMTAVPASSYAWIQTGGAGVVKADAGGAITVGVQIVASNQTAGTCENGADATDAQQLIGVAMTGIAQAEFGMAILTID